jgi:hypothetical protein
MIDWKIPGFSDRFSFGLVTLHAEIQNTDPHNTKIKTVYADKDKAFCSMKKCDQ